MTVQISLERSMFSEKPLCLLRSGSFSAICFKYETGVEALEISNGPVRYILLPYQGQQIWRLFIDDEDMTMKSMFEIPEETDNVFDESYGAFLIHCGLTAMGNPSEEDAHPMHGELPHARYRNISIILGSDEEGEYIEVKGEYLYKLSIDTSYTFCPALRLHAGKKLLDMTCNIRNLRSTLFRYMYMSHINWRPVDGARLVYSAPKDKAHIEVFETDSGDMLNDADSKRLREYTLSLAEKPDLGDVLSFRDQCYNPELCVCIHYNADESGWAHSMMIRPDASACYVGFETKILNNGLRWFSWTGDEMSCGFALPTTGNHMGRAYAVNHGLQKCLCGGQETAFHYRFGKLEAKEAADMEQKINSILTL
ncbi:MAG: DUF4432 family protein [Clostridiales bacterium]|nr:DUF4432 family protein [Clostridiales bacterium]